MDEDLGQVLAAVGPRLRELRRRRDVTLAALSRSTGISVSTLSRLESGQRRPTLELLLPLARLGCAARAATSVTREYRPPPAATAHLVSRGC